MGGMNSSCCHSAGTEEVRPNRRDLDHSPLAGRLESDEGALRELGVLHEGEPPPRVPRREDGGKGSNKWTTRAVLVPAYASRGAATSSGTLHRSTVCRRRELMAPLRNLYLETLRLLHNEILDPESNANPDKRAVVAALLDDLDAALLRMVAMDSRVQRYSIRSKKKVRQDVLREIKKEVKERRNNPLHIFQCAANYARQSGSAKAFSGVRSMCGNLHTAPSADAMASAKRLLWLLAQDDLLIMPSDDGFYVNLRAACEMEALRLLQTYGLSHRLNSGTRSMGLETYALWQDLWHVKITLDARRVTKRNCQTEVMMLFIPKGQAGVDRCQSAVHIRTIAVWAGKDSKDNVQRNLIPILEGMADLEKNGILYCPQADTFLGVHNRVKDWSVDQTKASGLRRANLEFWLPADMLAQCAAIGHGCAGDQFCAHCHVTKDNRHLPFQLVRLARETNFQALAETYSLFPETLHRINLPGHACSTPGDAWALTEEGLRACTQVSDGETSLEPAAAELSVGSESGADSSGETTGARCPKHGRAGIDEGGFSKRHKGDRGPQSQGVYAEASKQRPPSAAGSLRRAKPACSKVSKEGNLPQKGRAGSVGSARHRDVQAPRAACRDGRMRKDKGAAAAAAAAAAAKVAACRRLQGPDPALFRTLVGWKLRHLASCMCPQCVLPADAIVRIIPNHGFCRDSEFLKKHWPTSRRDHFPFCALHCMMRITEGLFFNVCSFALKSGDPTVQRLNKALKMIGMSEKKQFKKEIDPNGGPSFYSKMTFLGTDCLRFLGRSDAGTMNIELLLRSVWPSGDAGCTPDAANFVGRSVQLWGRWAELVDLMHDRDPANIRSKQGFLRFGKVCREFVCMYQTMYHKEHCKSFYLHTLLHHAGDFMRALDQAGMCLGMMSNSGAERRHANGRAAFKRSLCGGCWRKQDETLKDVPNLSAYLTLREIMVWQYGSDLLSHELAVLATKGVKQSSDRSVSIQSRRALAEHRAKAADVCPKDRSQQAVEDSDACDGGTPPNRYPSHVSPSAGQHDDVGASLARQDAAVREASAADVLRSCYTHGHSKGATDLNEFVKRLDAMYLSNYVAAESRRCREGKRGRDRSLDTIGSWLQTNGVTGASDFCLDVGNDLGDAVVIEDVPYEGTESDPARLYVSKSGAQGPETSGTYMPDWDTSLWNGWACDISEESGDGSEDRSTIAAWSEHSSEDDCDGACDADAVFFAALPQLQSADDEGSTDDPEYDIGQHRVERDIRRRDRQFENGATSSSESDAGSGGTPTSIQASPRDVTNGSHHSYATRFTTPVLAPRHRSARR